MPFVPNTKKKMRMVSEMSLYSMQEDNYLDEDMDGVEKLSCGCYEEMCECPQCEICGERITPDLEECPNEDEDWHLEDSETFEAKEIMDCSLCGNNLSPISKDDWDSLGAYINDNPDDYNGHAIGECNNCNLTYFSPPIEDDFGLKSKVLCNNYANEDGEGGFCAYPFDWNQMWEKRCEKCESGLHGRKGEIDRLNEHDCMDNSKVEIIEGDMILLECEICKKTKQYVSNQKSFNVEFNEWADQEMNSHGKNISFKDWSKDEGLKHGNTEITDWAQHEDESHDARYGAENYRYIKPVPISHSGGNKYNGYYAIKGYEGPTRDGFTYRILSSPGKSDWYRVYIYDTEKMFKNKSRRLNPSGKMVSSSDPASHLIGSFPRLDDAKRALVFRMIQDEQYHHILSDGNLNWLLHGKNPGSRKWKAETSGQMNAEFLYYYVLNEKGESPADFDTLEEAQAYVANSKEPLEIYERRNRDDEAYKMDKKMNAETFEAESRPYDFNKMPAIFKSWRVNTAYCINGGYENTLCGTGDRYSALGHGAAGKMKITCRKCMSKWNKLTDEEIKKIEEAWGRNGFEAESFSAPTKGIDTFTQPFEEASLDSGGTKKVLLGIGLGIIGYFGYNKWK